MTWSSALSKSAYARWAKPIDLADKLTVEFWRIMPIGLRHWVHMGPHRIHHRNL
jgi:hypothetical protein